MSRHVGVETSRRSAHRCNTNNVLQRCGHARLNRCSDRRDHVPPERAGQGDLPGGGFKGGDVGNSR